MCWALFDGVSSFFGDFLVGELEYKLFDDFFGGDLGSCFELFFPFYNGNRAKNYI